MITLRYMALVSLGIAFCTGCGDSSTQSWEKTTSKSDNTVKKDNATTAGESDNPHKMMNPHGGMPMSDGGSDAKLENTGKLDIEAIHFTVPKSWIRKVPNSMLLAEFAIPRAEGDKADGRLTVSRAGGTVDGNIDRWKGQFGAKPDKDKEETIDVGGIKATLVDFSGTFDDSRGMGPTPDYRLLGAIFETKGGLTFVKCYGPKKTIADQADEIKAFLRSLKVDK